MRAFVPIAREARAHGVSRPVVQVLGREDLLEREEASNCRRFANVRVIQDDEIVPGAEMRDAVRLEPFERLSVPVDRNAILFGEPRGRRGQCIESPGMIPGEAAVARHGTFCSSATAPAATNASISRSG